MIQKLGKLLIAALVIFFILIGYFYFTSQNKPVLLPKEQTGATPLYQGIGPVISKVSVLAENVPQITQIEITQDGNYMLASSLPGIIHIFHKVDGVWQRQIDPFFKLETAQPGWPPEEAGLTGVILGADFETSGDVFLTYSFAAEKKSFRNRVSRVTFSKQGKKIIGKNPKLIFEANTPGAGSHQIQDGIGIMIENKPHILFTVGEGFVAERALDPKQEAGKVILIDRDGNTASGSRPFADSAKVQALGIRNAPATAYNPKRGKIAIADTGPNNYDRFIYGTIVDKNGQNNEQLSLNWDGTEESLQKGSQDLYDPARLEMILYRWAPTETAVNILFYENERLPQLSENQDYVLVTLFGITGETGNNPGKQVLLGTLSHGAQNSLTFQALVERVTEGEGKLGHPLGLAVDSATKMIYFGDIIEGRIYQVEIGETSEEIKSSY